MLINKFLCFFLFIYGKNLVYTTEGSAGANPSPNSKTGVDLSLKATASTDQFDYNKNGKIVTFTAKGDHGFKSVKTKNKMVWQTTNTNEYASKVVLDGKGQKNKTVTIHMPNNTTKVLKREGKNKPWNETFELNIKEGDTSNNDNYEIKTDNDCYTYNIKSGKNCTTVKVGGNQVWKFDSSKFEAKCPDMVRYKKATVVIGFGSKYEVYSVKGGVWSINQSLTRDLNMGKLGSSSNTKTSGSAN